MIRWLVPSCLTFVLSAQAIAADSPAAAPDRAALEAKFEQTLSGCVFRGYFTLKGQEGKGLKEEKYTISKVVKVKDQSDLWTFHARIQYGDHDVTIPLNLEVKWAGDTPVITLTDLLVPGFGKFTCRIVVYGDQYAGTWDGGGDHGGHLFGKIEKAPAEEKPQ